MNPEVFAVQPDTPVCETVRRLREGPTELAHGHAVLVVDGEGRVEGVVTVDDVVAWLREGTGREGGLT